LRLDPRFRLALYAAYSALFVTGAGWLPANQMKDTPSTDEAWQMIGAYLLMIHGGAAMVVLMLLGALFPLHMQRGWRARRNRPMGAIMLTCTGALIATSFGLYYAGSDMLRPWMSGIHIGLGLCLPGLFLVHIVIGRRSSPDHIRV
jgi:hypothetical protein